MKIRDLGIGKKILLSFSTVVIIIATLASGIYWSFSKLAQANDRNNRAHEAVEMSKDMSGDYLNIVWATLGYGFTIDPGHLQWKNEHVGDFEQHLEQLKALTADDPQQQERLQRVLAEYRKWVAQTVQPIFALREKVNHGETSMEEFVAYVKAQGIYANTDALLDEMGKFDDAQKSFLAQSGREAAHLKSFTDILLFGGTGVSLLLAVLLSIWLTRIVRNPLTRAVSVAQAVASGDLRSDIQVESRDETGQLMMALKEMNDSLVHIVTQVRAGTESIGSASSQIAAGNLDLSSRTEEQAGSLETTASTMDQITLTVKQNAEHAHQANKMAASACAVAMQGGDVVSRVVVTMSAINAASKRIVDIIDVINNIAFQTNILALNAAVEAARAGEQGRGFAVVAAEVRNLAQRSAAAASEIKDLIVDTVAKVETGGELVGQAGATMDQVVASVKQVTGMISAIADASHAQSADIGRVNQAIGLMDQVTQQNAALVEQAAAAAASLQDQAAELVQAVSVFKLAAHEPAQLHGKFTLVTSREQTGTPALQLAQRSSSEKLRLGRPR